MTSCLINILQEAVNYKSQKFQDGKMKPIHGTIRTGNLVSLSQYDNNTIINQCTYTQTGERGFSGR